MEEQKKTNSAEFIGTLAGRPEFSHRSRNDDFYVFPMETERLSGTVDRLNVLARASLLRETELRGGEKLRVLGEVRSFNNRSGQGSRLVITVFARDLGFAEGQDENNVSLVGTVCRPPTFRKTPMGREICDLMLAVNRRYGRSDYIPCIAWGQTAAEASLWRVGTRAEIEGRLQSRTYIKTENGESTERTAFEVSVVSAREATEDE